MRRLVFWLAASVLAWTYAAFPIVLLLRARLRPQPVLSARIEPSVSVIIPAHNERASIGHKLSNLLGLDYPTDRLEVIVASDGSTDGTADVVRDMASARVQVLDLPRVGKAAALNAAIDAASGEIVVFADADSTFAPGAMRALMGPFADPSVGGVVGNQRYVTPQADGEAGLGERSYWDIDRRLKAAESDGGNVISAAGSIYAIRSELVEPVPYDVTDDFWLSTGVIARGARLVFEPSAIAFMVVVDDPSVEFGRKVRLMTRGLRGVVARRALLDPRRHGFYAIQLATHKVLRRLAGIPLIALALSAPLLWRQGPIYRFAALGQAASYGLAAAGHLLRERPIGRHPLLAIPTFFMLANMAALRATWNVVTGRRIDRWEPSRVEAPGQQIPLPAEAANVSVAVSDPDGYDASLEAAG